MSYVSKWQRKWSHDEDHKVHLNGCEKDPHLYGFYHEMNSELKKKAIQLSDDLKIHSYYRKFSIIKENDAFNLYIIFYKSEDATMFKLGWNA